MHSLNIYYALSACLCDSYEDTRVDERDFVISKITVSSTRVPIPGSTSESPMGLLKSTELRLDSNTLVWDEGNESASKTVTKRGES